VRQSVRCAAVCCSLLVLCSFARPQSAAAAGAASQARVIRVAVPNMIAIDKDDQKLAEALTDVLLVESNKLRGVEVIGMQDIEAVLGLEQKKTLLGCDDVSCMAEIGGALGVQAIVSSKVARIGRTYLLTIRVIDTKAVKPINSVQESVEGPPDALIAAARRLMPQALAPLASVAPEETASETPVAPAATAQQDSGGGGFSWPAIAVAGIGGVGALASVVIVGMGYIAYFGTPSTHTDRYYFYGPGKQDTVHGAAGFEVAGLATCGCSSLAVLGGLIWGIGSLIFGGGGD